MTNFEYPEGEENQYNHFKEKLCEPKPRLNLMQSDLKQSSRILKTMQLYQLKYLACHMKNKIKKSKRHNSKLQMASSIDI